jgi:hypothetical protein
MTEFSIKKARCIADWSEKAVACNGNVQCLDAPEENVESP